MTTSDNNKISSIKDQISGEAEIKSLFGLETESTAPAHPAVAIGHTPHDLPIVDGAFNVVEPDAEAHEVNTDKHAHIESFVEQEHAESGHEGSTSYEVHNSGGMFRSIVPYVLVFGLGVFLYYFYFTDFTFTQVFKNASNISKPKSKVAKAVEKLQEDRIEDYKRWMGQFYFQVGDASIIDPKAENCKCGLSNFEKYLLNLNPKIYDTRGNGASDGSLIAQNIDPATGEPFSGNRKKIVEAYFDTEVIADRLGIDDVEPVTGTGAVVGARSGGAESAGQVAQAHSGQPQTSSTNTIAIDTKYPAQLEIPSIGVKVPIIFSKTTNDFDHDLTLGAVHYPGTPLPGETGNAYVSAHSSALPWVNSPYKSIFAKFGDLKEGDTFNIILTLDSGKTIKLNYTIKQKGIYNADDQKQFINTAKSEVSLSTCWPIGTAKQRYVVRGELGPIEQ